MVGQQITLFDGQTVDMTTPENVKYKGLAKTLATAVGSTQIRIDEDVAELEDISVCILRYVNLY